MGVSVCGEEKLFHFTGNSCREIPLRIGLWRYQLLAQLSSGLPSLIHMRMKAHETVRGDVPLYMKWLGHGKMS